MSKGDNKSPEVVRVNGAASTTGIGRRGHVSERREDIRGAERRRDNAEMKRKKKERKHRQGFREGPRVSCTEDTGKMTYARRGVYDPHYPT